MTMQLRTPIRTPARSHRPSPARASSLGSRGHPDSEAARPAYAIEVGGGATAADLSRFRKPDPVAGPPPAHLHPNSHPAW